MKRFYFSKEVILLKYADLMNLTDIYLDNISEPEENHLRLTFSRSNISNVSETIALGDVKIDNLYSIDIDYTLPLIQLDFEWYIAYSIINESYAIMDDYEEFEGKVFRIFNKSRYLDYIKVGTIATDEYPGPFVHYEIACLNHIVDVVSMSEPVVQEIDR